MWAKTLAKRSKQPLARATPTNFISSLGSVDESNRRFSSDDNRDKQDKLPPLNLRGRGGGGRGGGGGVGGINRPPHPSGNQQPHGRRPQKPNFTKEFIEPAVRGELKNHRSTIPKLAGRKSKGHGVRGADGPLPKEEEDELDFTEMDNLVDLFEKKQTTAPKLGTIANNSPMDQLSPDEREKVEQFMRDYQALISSDEVEKYYWNERDYDNAEELKRAEILQRLEAEATRDEDGNLVVEVEDEIFAMFDAIPEEKEKASDSRRVQPAQVGSRADDNAFQFVVDAMGIEGADKPPTPDYDRVLPLQLSGPTMYDFVESMMNHPSKFGEVRWEAPNEQSKREPLAKLPPTRRNPPLEFVEAYKRFIYVWGLPPFMVDGEPADLENPMHCLTIQKIVGGSFDVPLEQVSVASPSSAFVGFSSVDDQKFAVAVGPMINTIESPVILSKYAPADDFVLAKEYPDSLILLQNLPLGVNATVLAESLFPEGTDVCEIYGTLSVDRIIMLSPNSAVVAMESAEAADNAVSSAMVKERMIELGRHRIRYTKARRELVLSGTHGGPDGTEPLRKLGPRLIVDGDMPTKHFFTSHASTLFLRDLDPAVTKQDIADFFQPYCSVPRDVDGSTEFVTCREGLPTGRAFVGFDEYGEAEAALDALNQGKGRLVGLGPTIVIADHVKERTKKTPSLKRPTRSEDELLDSLNNWQQFVDPADIQLLIENDISIEALTETFRAIRFHNDTFASMDQALRSETINPEKEAGGMFQELVQTYIATLKECIATPENPGPIYKSIHFVNEPIDTEIFETEAIRVAELQRRREVPK